VEFGEVAILVRLVVGAFGTFCAILLWARSRDLAWILVILGILVAYAGIVITTLEAFGLLRWQDVVIAGVPAAELVSLVLTNLPTILISLGLLVALARMRLR
jgi:hypothetical protein